MTHQDTTHNEPTLSDCIEAVKQARVKHQRAQADLTAITASCRAAEQAEKAAFDALKEAQGDLQDAISEACGLT